MYIVKLYIYIYLPPPRKQSQKTTCSTYTYTQATYFNDSEIMVTVQMTSWWRFYGWPESTLKFRPGNSGFILPWIFRIRTNLQRRQGWNWWNDWIGGDWGGWLRLVVSNEFSSDRCPPSRYRNSSKWQVDRLWFSFDISRGISCATYFFTRCFTRVLKLENACGSQISKHEVCPCNMRLVDSTPLLPPRCGQLNRVFHCFRQRIFPWSSWSLESNYCCDFCHVLKPLWVVYIELLMLNQLFVFAVLRSFLFQRVEVAISDQYMIQVAPVFSTLIWKNPPKQIYTIIWRWLYIYISTSFSFAQY